MLALLLVPLGLAAQTPLGPAFTYQGLLEEAGVPTTGAFDFEFYLYDAAAGGLQIGPTLILDDLQVTDGLFAIELDFGASSFDGDGRWLEVHVRPGTSTGTFTVLSPRQALTATPYATFSQASDLALDVPDDSIGTSKIADSAVTNIKVANGIAYSKLAGAPTALPPTGPAGGDLEGSYPSPSIRDSSVVKSLRTLQGDVNIVGGEGIDVDDAGQTITITNTGVETTRSWHFNIGDLTDPQAPAVGGPALFTGADLFAAVPVYEFVNIPGNTLVGGVTSLPLSSELEGGTLTVELYWVVSQDGGEVRWRFAYSSRLAGNRLNEDDDLTVITPVTNTGSDRLYKTTFVLDSGFNSGDELLAFTLTRQGTIDSNMGTVGLLAIRFVYAADT